MKKIRSKYLKVGSTIICLLIIAAYSGCSKKSDVVLTVHHDVKAYNLRGNELYYKGDYIGAARNYDRARVLARGINDLRGEAESLNNLGQLYLVASDTQAARKKFDAAYELNKTIKNEKGMAANLNNIGSLYIQMADFTRAKPYLEEAIGIDRKIQNSVAMANVTNNLGLAEMGLGNYEQASKHFNVALKIAREHKRHRLAAACLQNIGALRERQGNYDDALLSYKQALASDKLVEYSVGIADDLADISRMESKLGQMSKANDCMDRALFINTKLGFEKKMKSNLSALIDYAKQSGDRSAKAKYEAKLRRLRTN